MFDLFSVSASEVNEALQVHAVNYATLLILLHEKGIFTAEEIDTARVKATHYVDQAWAQKVEEANKEFDEQHPGMREMFGRITGISKEQ